MLKRIFENFFKPMPASRAGKLKKGEKTMALNLNPTLKNKVQPSATFAVSNAADALIKQGKDVIGFGAGAPDEPFAGSVFQHGVQLLSDINNAVMISKYPPIAGMPKLINAVVEKHQQQAGVTLTPENVLITNGGKQALFNFMLSVVNPGVRDEVILLAPAFVSYLPQVHIAGGKEIIIQGKMENGWKISPEEIEAYITDKTAAIIICSPNNPTGHMYGYDELQAITDVLSKHPDVWVFSDEVYDDLVFDPHYFTPMLAFKELLGDRLVVSNGISKGYAMTGLRGGWIITTNSELMKSLKKLQSHSTSGICTLTQLLGAHALGLKDSEWTEAYCAGYAEKSRILTEALLKIDGVKLHQPEGSLYVYPSFQEWSGKHYDDGGPITTCQGLAMHLLEHGLVAAVPGGAFFSPPEEMCLRLSACPAESKLIEGAERIGNFLANLK